METLFLEYEKKEPPETTITTTQKTEQKCIRDTDQWSCGGGCGGSIFIFEEVGVYILSIF